MFPSFLQYVLLCQNTAISEGIPEIIFVNWVKTPRAFFFFGVHAEVTLKNVLKCLFDLIW